MTKRLGVIAEVDDVSQVIAVTGVVGGSGIAIPISTSTSQVTITNTSVSCNIQFRVNGGIWSELSPAVCAQLQIDLASNTVYTRRASIDGGNAIAEITTEGAPVLKTQGGA